MRYQEVKNEADKLLCESYVKQATYEERSQHWPEAARTWQKVAKIRVGDVNANAQAAQLPPEGRERRPARRRPSTRRWPSPASRRSWTTTSTLAEIYLKAGLTASARRAAETGLALDPKNAALLAIAKKAAKA